MFRDALQLKQIQNTLLRMINDRPRTSKELIDLFAVNFPEDYRNESGFEGFNDAKLFSILRQMKEKNLISQDPSRRWVLVEDGKEVLRQESILSFSRIIQTIGTSLFQKYKLLDSVSPDIQVADIAPLDFPNFPPPATVICLETMPKGVHYIIDIPPTPNISDNELIERNKKFHAGQKRLAALVPDVKVIFGTIRNSQIQEYNEEGEYILLEDDSLDESASQFLLGLTEDHQVVLAEIYRVLKPGASFKLVEYIAEESLFQILVEEVASIGMESFPPIYQRVLNAGVNLNLDKIKEIVSESPFEIEQIFSFTNLPVLRLRKQET